MTTGSSTRIFVLAALVASLFSGGAALGQTPATPAPKPPAVPAPATTAPKVEANLLQLMRGIVYPASNVIFAAQDDFSKQPVPPDASTSPNPLTTTYGGWQAVENAALALSESANLILVPGRMCSNGKPAPVRRGDWIKDVQKLREAGRAAYNAAKKKDRDAMVDVSGTISDACSSCHDVYREKKGGEKDRCLP